MLAILSDTLLIFRRSLRQTLRSKLGVLFGLLQPLLYLAFFGPLLGGAGIGTSTGGEGRWQEVLVPALLVQLGLFGAAFAGFSVIMEKKLGVIERMRVTPVSRVALLAGRALRDAVQLLIQSTLLVLAGVAMGLRTSVLGVALGFVLVALLSLALASLSYALAMRVDTPQEFAPVINAVNMPAMLLSGILLPMALAPTWLNWLSHIVPFRYIVDAERQVFLSHYLNSTVGIGAAVAVALSAASLALGARTFIKVSA